MSKIENYAKKEELFNFQSAQGKTKPIQIDPFKINGEKKKKKHIKNPPPVKSKFRKNIQKKQSLNYPKKLIKNE